MPPEQGLKTCPVLHALPTVGQYSQVVHCVDVDNLTLSLLVEARKREAVRFEP